MRVHWEASASTSERAPSTATQDDVAETLIHDAGEFDDMEGSVLQDILNQWMINCVSGQLFCLAHLHHAYSYWQKKPITQVKNKNVKPPEQNMTAVDGCIKQLLEELSYKLLSQFANNNLTEMCALRYVICSSILPTDLLE